VHHLLKDKVIIRDMFDMLGVNLKTFFLQIFPTAAFPFLLQD